MEGPLSEWRDGWRHRWFVLDRARGLLSYYASKMKKSSRRGSVQLKGATVGVDDEDARSFTVENRSKKYRLQAENMEEREKWVSVLEEYIRNSPEVEEVEEEGEEEESEIESDVSEEFYDADEGLDLQPATTSLSSMAISSQLADSESDSSDIEEDPEYVEHDDVSSNIAQHRSMIMHILSQARLGLDLTRMRLPAFILEKRSTLEMCSEFLAHPDIFTAIHDQATPRERMVAVVRFYCSAFNAARTGVAKKPYNPILGETFHCFWDLPGGKRRPPDEHARSLIQSGPVPYASYDSVAFVGEQVSHHPPVSAFYAECVPKRMYINGSVHTKIRFLGLSVGVYNTATVTFSLLDHGEEYTMTLPNTYIRSILTYPWMEMGGRVAITCPQTGYHAHIDFHCKPFYGGKKHHITGEVSHKSEKKPFMKLEGEWNGVMYTKHSKDHREVFMDTINTPTLRKKLLKLSAQEAGDSRRRWHDVTEALKRGDIDTASEAKHILEEKQRADAKMRQEHGIEWQQKVNHSTPQCRVASYIMQVITLITSNS